MNRTVAIIVASTMGACFVLSVIGIIVLSAMGHDTADAKTIALLTAGCLSGWIIPSPREPRPERTLP